MIASIPPQPGVFWAAAVVCAANLTKMTSAKRRNFMQS
jgi:hypothetical protein